jgi:hypothetical protein
MTTWTPRFQAGDFITWGNVINQRINSVDLVSKNYNFGYYNLGGSLYGPNVDDGVNTEHLKIAPAVLNSGPSKDKIGGKRKRTRRNIRRNNKSKRRVQKRKSYRRHKHL